jgi:hypothetical protein
MICRPWNEEQADVGLTSQLNSGSKRFPVHLMQVPFGFFYVTYAMILYLWRLMMVFNVNNAGFREGNA